MLEKIRPVEVKLLKEKQAILIDQVLDGFRAYPHVLVQGKAASLQQFLFACLEFNGEEQSFADCYYGQLKKSEQQRFVEGLSDMEKGILSRFAWEEGAVFYPLTKENLPLLSDITARGWLFSTFYFTRYPCTIWGNYDGVYPIFCRSQAELNPYLERARACGLVYEKTIERGSKR